jgi:uncharacterized protein (DUF486 family)
MSLWAVLQSPFGFFFLLTCSNVIMLFAWYGHLKNLAKYPLWIAILVSWLIAGFEYMLQVPANRIGYSFYTLGQLKIIEEIITLILFVPFSIFYMGEPFKMDFVWAGCCLVAAAYFIFRDHKTEGV